MKVKVNNKKVLIVMLMILLLMLAVGYAVFSEILTISGTANARGTFDLEFQNAEVVKNVGANIENTTAEISGDKNTLTVNVADLSYPGAGVEFAVDIVNVGTMPAEVHSVTPTNITGSDKIKVTGLEGIQVGHPKIEVGDRCNIHFIVEWPIEVTEILDSESTISFGLQVEYTQATGQAFEGNVSHIDTDKVGNQVSTNTSTTTNTITNTVPSEPEEPKGDPIVSQITASDYGKRVNYTATVKGQKVSNWKLLYKDENKMYIILDDFLPINLVPTEAGLVASGTYQVYSNTNRDALLKGLTTESYWSEFANGVEGATAQGTPAFDILMKSYNEKNNASMKTDPTVSGTFTINNTDTLYVPHTSGYNGVNGYRLASAYPGGSANVWFVGYKGLVGDNYYFNSAFGVRPVVSLPSSITGTVGDEIEIEEN